MATKLELLAFISEKVSTYWAEKKEPLLLSNIPAVVQMGLHCSYKDIVDGVSLKKFFHAAAREDGANITVVSHPVVKALVGLVPKGENYTFIKNPSASAELPAGRETVSNEQVVREFLSLVAKLPADDVKRVVIPMEILTQLMFGK